jgi:uracil-DNA glycosylase
MPAALEELVDASWLPALDPHRATLAELGEFLREETAAGRPWAPGGTHILRAFQQPIDAVRVLILGQDPYPTPGHAVGLSFSVAPDVQPIPRSLQNIFRELTSDLDVARPSTGDLTPWTTRGVLLLNRVLTVSLGQPGSHRGRGWETITGAALNALADRQPLVAILWGKDAQGAQPALAGTPVITSAHPSPMSADRGFFGSRPFSRANAALIEQGGEAIDWTLP